jgi:hypothetical protein
MLEEGLGRRKVADEMAVGADEEVGAMYGRCVLKLLVSSAWLFSDHHARSSCSLSKNT